MKLNKKGIIAVVVALVAAVLSPEAMEVLGGNSAISGLLTGIVALGAAIYAAFVGTRKGDV